MTDEARRVFARARKEAGRLRHDFIGPEHMLLGLIDTQALATLLLALGLDANLPEVSSALRSGTFPSGRKISSAPCPAAREALPSRMPGYL